jgi:chemotaxis signal transduction protein
MNRFEDRARALREAFDLSFAAPPPVALEERDDLLMIRVAGDRYAIRLREIGGIVGKRPIVAVPAAAEHLLGLAGVRGDVLPVFSLASILGHSETEAPAWMVLCGDAPAFALAFAHFDGYTRVPLSRMSADTETRNVSPHVSHVLTTDEGMSAIISVTRIITALRKQKEP